MALLRNRFLILLSLVAVATAQSSGSLSSDTSSTRTTDTASASSITSSTEVTTTAPSSTSSDTESYVTTGSTGSSILYSSYSALFSFTPGSTASATGPGGIDVQNPPNPAETHPFTAYVSPTQSAVDGISPETDPLSPPEAGKNLIPNFDSAWEQALSKAKELISNFSVEEKVNFTTGVFWEGGLCAGNMPAVPADGSGTWKGLCLHDGPIGVRSTDFATAFPAGINAAATWQRSLIRERGYAIGEEFKGKGVQVALGPMMNLGRVAQGGRNWEGFGADPFLAGESAYETILGIQAAGVQAVAKHYVDNEQEHNRTTESSNVNDRAQHELYVAPFLRSVQAGVVSVMCSYNQINETYACENDRTLNQILKDELGFKGYVMSDWGAHHSTVASAIHGLDMSMPGDGSMGDGWSYWGANLTLSVNNGSVSEERLDDMATRVAAAWYFIHQDEGFPETNFNSFDPLDEVNNKHVDVQGDHAELVRKIDAASTVLLKNKNGALPLNKPKRLGVIGLDAGPQPEGPNPFYLNTGNTGILAVGWGSGSANLTYVITPLEAIQARSRKDRTTVDYILTNYDLKSAGDVAYQADTAIVFVNSDSGENIITYDGNEGDRRNLTAWHNGDALVLAAAAQNNNTIVVVHSVGPMIMEDWIEHENITAVVWAGLGGTETGNGLVDVLYGDVNPSARLPYTIAKDVEDYGVPLILGGDPDSILQIPYEEELLIDYRHFDAAGIEPRYEFGYGLSYTTFGYSELRVLEVDNQYTNKSVIKSWKNGTANAGGEGVGSSTALWLHEPAYKVTFSVENTGDVAGTEIPQLYISFPESAGSPPSILKGFTDVYLEAGESRQLAITISRYDLSIWDVVSQSWVRPQGDIGVKIGASSRDLRLNGTILA